MQRLFIIPLALLIALSVVTPACALEPEPLLEPVELGILIEKLLTPQDGNLTFDGLQQVSELVWNDDFQWIGPDEIELTAQMRPFLDGEAFHNPVFESDPDFEGSWTLYAYLKRTGFVSIALVSNGASECKNGDPLTIAAIVMSNPRLKIKASLEPRERNGRIEFRYLLQAPGRQSTPVMLSMLPMGKTAYQPIIFVAYYPDDSEK